MRLSPLSLRRILLYFVMFLGFVVWLICVDEEFYFFKGVAVCVSVGLCEQEVSCGFYVFYFCGEGAVGVLVEVIAVAAVEEVHIGGGDVVGVARLGCGVVVFEAADDFG